MAALFGIRALLTARLVMRTLIAQPGEPHRLLLEPTNGGNREKCILRAAITLEFPPRTYSTFSRVENARSSTRHSLRRRPPFFPAICALRIYGRTFVCRPQYMGDVIIVIRGLPPRTWTAAWHWRAPTSSDKAKLFNAFLRLVANLFMLRRCRKCRNSSSENGKLCCSDDCSQATAVTVAA